MKNIRILVLAAALASPAFAIDWSVGGTYSGSPLAFLQGTNGSSFYTTNFANITTAGFNPATHTLTSATASFWFADDDGDDSDSDASRLELVDIYVNGIKRTGSPQEVDGDHPGNGQQWQNTFDKYSYVITDQATLTALQSGPVSFKVQLVTNGSNGGGDTYLKVAGLVATGTNRVNVPDGGATAAMLGLGMIALVAAGRRFGQNR